MTHDPICRRKGVTEALMGGCPECDLIAKARREERAAAVQRVEALKWDYTHSCGELITRARTIAAIKGDSHE